MTQLITIGSITFTVIYRNQFVKVVQKYFLSFWYFLNEQALKTAQREQKNVMDHARGEIKMRMIDDAKDAMERIRKSVMSPADITGHQFAQLELRCRYVKMSAAEAINTVFTNAFNLAEYDRDLHQLCLSLSRVVTKPLSCSLFQLALCSGDLNEPDDLPKGFLNSEEEEDDEDEEDREDEDDEITSKAQPTEGKFYLCHLWSLAAYIPKSNGRLSRR